VVPVTELCDGNQIGAGDSAGQGTRLGFEERQTKIRGADRSAPPRKELSYLLMESFVIDPPFSIFTLITWIWPLSA